MRTTKESKILVKCILIVTLGLGLVSCRSTSDATGLPNSNSSTTGIPDAPTGLSISGLTDFSVTLSWTDNADDEVIYEIQQCTGASCTSFAANSNSPKAAGTTTITITSLASATVHRFRVRATNSTGSSEWLTSGDVTTTATTISAPTTFSVTAQNTTSVSFSWVDNATNETGYAIERCTGASCSVFAAVAGSPIASGSTSTTVTGLTASTTYRFRVAAVDGGSSSTYLTSSDVTTAPAAPTVLTAGTITGTSIQFGWTDNASDESSYVVESCTGASCSSYSAVPSSPIAANSVTHNETGLTEATTYRFRVKTSNANGSSSYLTSTDLSTIVTAPTGISITGLSDTSLTVNWTDNSAAELIYEVQQCTGTGCTTWAASALSPRAANATSIAISGLTEASIYRFRVRATNSTTSSAWLTSGDVTTNPSSVSAPTAFAVTAKTSTSVSFSWADNASNETAYEVYSCTGSGCTTYAAVAGSPFAANTTTATVSALAGSTTYRFQVRAITAANQSTYLTSSDITTPPPAPTVLVTGAVTKDSIGISWTDNSSDEVIYDIEKCTGTGCTGFAAAATSPKPANTVSYTESSLAENTIYRFRVMATSGNGSSTALTSGDITTLMAPPTGIAASAITDTTLTLSWTDNSATETGYEVESCSGASCVGFVAIGGSPFAANTTSIPITGLTASTTYRFRVRAAGAVPSTYATTADTPTAPAAPTGFTNGTISYNSIGFTWTDNATGETAYHVERCTGASCSGFAALTTVLPANTASYTDSTVSGSTVYRYRVRAAGAAGNSNYLTSGDITSTAAPTPALACTSPNHAVVDIGQKGIVAGTNRGLFADTKYIPSGTAVGTGTASGNTVIVKSSNVGVAYYDTGALAIKYAYWNGSSFTNETVVGDSIANVWGVQLVYLSNSPNTGIPIIFWASGNSPGINAGQITMAVRSNATLAPGATWTVSAVDTTGGVVNKGLEATVSPIDQVLIAYQASTVPAANVARVVLCSSSCTSAANYNTMGASQVVAATASQIKLGVGWCNRGSGIYNPSISVGTATAATYATCRPAGPTNNLASCLAAGGWTTMNILGTGALVVTDLYLDPHITNDVPRAVVKDATNVKGYLGNAGCGTTASFTYTASTILGSTVGATGNQFYKLLKHPDYAAAASERFVFMFNDAATDVKWANTTSSTIQNTTWNQTANAIQTVPLNAVPTATAGADLNPSTGQMVVAYGTSTANTFNINLGVVDNYLLAPNNASQVYYIMPVDSSGHIQMNGTQQHNLSMSKTSTSRPAMAYVDFSAGALTTGRLKYAIRSSATFAGSSWVVSTLPSPTVTFSPQFPSIAFDHNNKPWIGYFESNTNRFYLSTNTATDGTGTWINYQFPNALGTHGAPTAALPGQNMTAVAMSYSGGVASPVMIIADTGTTDQLKSAKLNTSTGVWSNNVQISTIGATGINSLTADFSTTSNTIVISLYDIANTRLRYSVTSDAGATWPLGLVNVGTAGTGMGIGARVRINTATGFPGIAYYDRVNARIFYATCGTVPASCTAGNWSGTGSSVLNGVGVGGVLVGTENVLDVGLTYSAAGDAYINYTSGQLDVGAIRMIDNVGGSMPSGLATTVVAGSNGAFSNAAAINGGIPWSVQTERFSTGVLGLGYIGVGNNLSYSSCGD